MHNSTTSQWLAPNQTAGDSFDPTVDGVYKWTLTFDLTGYNPATAWFNGRWATDNGGTVTLNGNSLGVPSNSSGYNNFTPFSANTFFNNGSNTLVFTVTNDHLGSGNPTGLRVEFTESSVTAVPEPETYALLLAGLGLMGTIARRRKNSPV